MLSLPLGYVKSFTLYTVVGLFSCEWSCRTSTHPDALWQIHRGHKKGHKGKKLKQVLQTKQRVASWRERLLTSQWISAGLVIRVKLASRGLLSKKHILVALSVLGTAGEVLWDSYTVQYRITRMCYNGCFSAIPLSDSSKTLRLTNNCNSLSLCSNVYFFLHHQKLQSELH